jgi:hypothetical protein
MGVASCRSIFLLSDVVFNRVFVSSCFGFRFMIGFRSVVVRVVGFCPATRPSPARSALARAPLAPVPPPCAPPFSPFLSFDFPAQQPPLLHLSLSPYGALGFGDGDRQIWTPRCAPLHSPSHSPSPSLSSPPVLLPCVRPLPRPSRVCGLYARRRPSSGP